MKKVDLFEKLTKKQMVEYYKGLPKLSANTKDSGGEELKKLKAENEKLKADYARLTNMYNELGSQADDKEVESVKEVGSLRLSDIHDEDKLVEELKKACGTITKLRKKLKKRKIK
ncbi:MAG: hypothetical protein GY853_13815 [PVC group bacterium]|nr:hypothetical protein [PVC group bacterium]